MDRPILFSGPMVRAILSGAKTQTRRVVRKHAQITDEDFTAGMEEASRKGWPGVVARGPCDGIQWRTSCPHGAVGDHLWVRESGYTEHSVYDDEDEYDTPAAASYFRWAESPRIGRRLWTAGPQAGQVQDITFLAESSPLVFPRTWRATPSIHMPRWASRLTLRVTGVRVERLQAITEEDARAEGVVASGIGGELNHRGQFHRLWDSINGHRAPWASNPFVWVVSFERVATTHARETG